MKARYTLVTNLKDNASRMRSGSYHKGFAGAVGKYEKPIVKKAPFEKTPSFIDKLREHHDSPSSTS